MRKIIFTLAFTLIASIGFSMESNNSELINPDNEVTISSNITSIDLNQITDIEGYLEANLEEDEFGCVELFFNGEFIGFACGETLGDIIDNILDLFF